MSQTLKGKVCVITGAGGRIGRAIVDRFLVAGATVIGLDILKVDIPGVEGVQCDVGDPGSILQLEEHLKKQYGSIDCLVNNGAVGGNRAPLHEKPLDEFEQVFKVNARGPFLLMQSAIRLHLEVQSQHKDKLLSIINVASICADKPIDLGSIYAASKAALVSFTKAAAKEYGSKGIRSNSVSPGFMEVPNVQGFKAEDIAKMHALIPRGRPGAPSDVANLVAWLASDESVHANGADFLLDGGEKL